MPSPIPEKRRPGRPQRKAADDLEEVRAWRMMFRSGHDYLNDLKFLGLPYGLAGDQEKQRLAEEVWHRIGAKFLERHPPPPDKPYWALEQFGPPSGAQ